MIQKRFFDVKRDPAIGAEKLKCREERFRWDIAKTESCYRGETVEMPLAELFASLGA